MTFVAQYLNQKRMKLLLLLMAIGFLFSSCGNETKTETKEVDSSAMIIVDSVKREMNRVEDSSERAKDTLR